MDEHTGRVAAITGGAGAIGAAAAVALAARGAAVAVIDHHAERTADVVARLRANGATALGVVADLTEDGATGAAAERVRGELGEIDVLVNALGDHLGLSGSFVASEEEQWDRLYRVNLLQVMQMTRAVVPAMVRRGWGRVVNFSSVEGIRAMPGAAPYAAFNAAVDAFTRSLGVELAPAGVRVNAIAVDKTASYQTRFYDYLESREAFLPGWIPAGRIGRADDVVPLVVLLASDDSDWIVGQTLVADGGTLAAGGWHRAPTGWTNTPDLREYAALGEPAADADGAS